MALTLINRPTLRAAIYTLSRTKTSWEWATVKTTASNGTTIPAGTYLLHMDDGDGNFGKVRFTGPGVLRDVAVDGGTVVHLPTHATVYVNGSPNRTDEQLKVTGALLITPVTTLSLSLSRRFTARWWSLWR